MEGQDYSDDLFEQAQMGFRARMQRIISSRLFERIIIALIIINAIVLGLQTSAKAKAALGEPLEMIDTVILGIFVVEILLRILVYGKRFWTDPWSVFDFTVVGIAIIPATGNLSILRAFRILRALRLISTIESMRVVVAGLLRALPGMGSIILLLVLITYVFSVMATRLFGAQHPELFGTIGASAYTLFQIMTLDGWSSEVVRPVMTSFPWAWAFFVTFILVTSFTVLNLFIGIIVEAIQSQHHVQDLAAQERTEAELDAVMSELKEIREDLRALRERGD